MSIVNYHLLRMVSYQLYIFYIFFIHNVHVANFNKMYIQKLVLCHIREHSDTSGSIVTHTAGELAYSVVSNTASIFISYPVPLKFTHDA